LLFDWFDAAVIEMRPQNIFMHLGTPDEIQLAVSSRRGFFFWITYLDPEIHIQYRTYEFDVESSTYCFIDELLLPDSIALRRAGTGTKRLRFCSSLNTLSPKTITFEIPAQKTSPKASEEEVQCSNVYKSFSGWL